MDSEKIRLTGLWAAPAQPGSLSGKISPTTRLLILPNTNKKSSKEPDFIAYIAPTREELEEMQTRQESLFHE